MLEEIHFSGSEGIFHWGLSKERDIRKKIWKHENVACNCENTRETIDTWFDFFEWIDWNDQHLIYLDLFYGFIAWLFGWNNQRLFEFVSFLCVILWLVCSDQLGKWFFPDIITPLLNSTFLEPFRSFFEKIDLFRLIIEPK